MRFTSPRVQPKFSHSEPFLSDESLLTPDKTQFAAGLSGEQAFRRTNDFYIPAPDRWSQNFQIAKFV